jgi:UDP-N-acetylmuramoyl-L-alanyl-D-glutamate--2,6-diaminopimelate ligase
MTSALFRSEDGLAIGAVAREIPGGVEVVGDAAARVFGVHHDSRRIGPGDLFVARKGAQSDGTRFIAQAKASGAAAVLTRRGDVDTSRVGLPVLLVDDIAAGLAYAAAAVYGHPTFSLEVVGITGTNGKTTTAHLVRAAVDGALGKPLCGIVGTVGHVFGDLHIDAAHTTPEADELARVMAAMRKRGATHVVMEVSSIALSLGRARAVRFRVAAFTNLTQDHLDFHGSMEDYARAKESLFFEMAPGSAVVNVDNEVGRSIASRVRAPLFRVTTRVGAGDDEAQVAPLEATMNARGIDVLLRTPRGTHRVRSRLVGRHNLENLVVAVGVAAALDLDMERACAAIGAEAGAPGRLERCDEDQDDVTVLVDYAHTPDALVRVLESVRQVGQDRRIVCIFGCGGDRDPKKRAPMGRAVARGADVAILTNDNPRTEDPEAIARAVEIGLREENASYRIQLDRAAAIREAIAGASAGDVIVVAGKGHEDYQIIGSEKLPFDDRVHARQALAERRRS